MVMKYVKDVGVITHSSPCYIRQIHLSFAQIYAALSYDASSVMAVSKKIIN